MAQREEIPAGNNEEAVIPDEIFLECCGKIPDFFYFLRTNSVNIVLCIPWPAYSYYFTLIFLQMAHHEDIRPAHWQ